MKIKFLSDTHNAHHELEVGECDVLIHTGDVGTKGNLTEALDFLWWFVKQNAKYKVLLGGNHDVKLKTHPDAIKLAKDLGIIVLNNDYVEINGLKIYGVSATFKGHDDPRYLNSEYGSITDRVNAWKDIPEGLDILLTHMPPYGILDLTKDNSHIGCKMLLEKVKQTAPRFHFFGHIHECHGMSAKVYNTEFNNVSCMNREYELVHNFHPFEIEKI